MQSLKSPYTLYNQQSVGSTLHNNLLFITVSFFLFRSIHDLHQLKKACSRQRSNAVRSMHYTM